VVLIETCDGALENHLWFLVALAVVLLEISDGLFSKFCLLFPILDSSRLLAINSEEIILNNLE